MIDEATIRKQLTEFRSRLVQLDEERQAVESIVTGYESLLRTMGTADTTLTPAAAPSGSVSMRSAVRHVLERAEEPLHSRDILARAQAAGATTTAKDPSSVVDLVVLGLAQKGLVTKTAPRTWQWSGPSENRDGAPM